MCISVNCAHGSGISRLRCHARGDHISLIVFNTQNELQPARTLTKRSNLHMWKLLTFILTKLSIIYFPEEVGFTRRRSISRVGRSAAA